MKTRSMSEINGQRPLIFNISPHRSGTKSYVAFCEQAGLRARHWPGEEFDAQVEKGSLWRLATSLIPSADVFADLPWPNLFACVAANYPEAKFVFIRRDVLDWINSARRHTNERNLSHLEKRFYLYLLGNDIDRLCQVSDSELTRAYCWFLHTVRLELGSRLTIFDLEDRYLGRRLAAYHGFDDVLDFPHVKDSL